MKRCRTYSSGTKQSCRHLRPNQFTSNGYPGEWAPFQRSRQSCPRSAGDTLFQNQIFGDYKVEFHGLLKYFNHERGFGFIVPGDGGKDHFVHATDLQNSRINVDLLIDGKTRLSYDVEQDERNGKLKAVNLRVL
jgi:CspA family cold shock protein